MCKQCRDTRLINISSGEAYDISIARPSKWGNPFTHIKDRSTLAKYVLSTRKEAIDAYRKYITKGEGKWLLDHLDELRGKTISCFCYPKSCHGDILIELIHEFCPNNRSIL